MVFATKVGKIYPYLHLLLMSGCLFWYAVIEPSGGSDRFFLAALLGYAIIVLFFGWLSRQKYIKLANLFLVHTFFDGALIAFIIRLTGGFGSDFTLAFYPVVAMAAVVSTGWRGYVCSIWYEVTMDSWILFPKSSS